MPHTLLIDRSVRSRFEISGAHAIATLNGLVTNDVAALKPGSGQYAAALTAKGKVVSDVVILMIDDKLQLHASQEAGAGLHAMLLKFINPRFATLRDVSATTFEQTLVGSDAADMIERASAGSITAATLSVLPAYSHIRASIGGNPVDVVHLPAIGAANEPVFSVIGACDAADVIRNALLAAGAHDADAAAIETLRVESGYPAWGIDMDDTTLSQEANLDDMHAVSYTKGCYIGQETVARIHFRGHVNRSLRRLSFTGDELPPHGAVLQDSEHRAIGDVRSTARSVQSGMIGIGMVRREIDDGVIVDVHWDGGGATAVVVGKAKGAID